MSRTLLRHEAILAVLLLLALAVLAMQSDRFFTVENLLNQGRLMAEVGLVALADAKRLADAAIRFEGGPAWARREHEVAGPGPVVLALSREIARRFDASGVLAPERVVAAGASA